MALQTSVIDPFQVDFSKETPTEIQSRLDELDKDIKNVLNMIADGQQSDFFTDFLVTSIYDFQLLSIKKMFHQSGLGDKTLMFHRCAHSSEEREELLNRCFQQLSNIGGDVERLNKVFSKIRMDINKYLKDYAEMWGFHDVPGWFSPKALNIEGKWLYDLEYKDLIRPISGGATVSYSRTKEAKELDNLSQSERGEVLMKFNEDLSDSFHNLKMILMEKDITPEDIQEYITISYNMWVNAMMLQANHALQYEAGLSLIEKCVPLHKLDNINISDLLSNELNKAGLDSFDKMTIMRGVHEILNDKYNQSCSKISK